MNIAIFESKDKASEYVSKKIINQISSKSNSILCLASGETMIEIYKKIADGIKKDNIDVSNIKTFNLDEYYDVNYESSLRKYMDDNFFSKINTRNNQINFLNHREKDWKKECKRYQTLLDKNKIDLQLLGLGKNSHIAFNEPGSTLNSKTRKIKLSDDTAKDKKLDFKDVLTIGIKDIMKTRKIILVAYGKSKAEAVYNSFSKKTSKKYPASFLQKHKNVEIVLDKEASSLLKRIK